MAEKEYIERNSVIRHLSDEIEECGDACESFLPLTYGTIFGLMGARSFVNTLPAADVVEVRHGEWFLLDECANEGVYCSVCTKKVYRTEYANQKLKSKYCPNCGAKMDGERKEQK